MTSGLSLADLTAGDGAMAPVAVAWTVRDVIAYALGTGAAPQADLDYLYEGRGPKVLPTFASCMATRWIPELRRRLDDGWGSGVIASHRWTLGDAPLEPAGDALVEWSVRAGAVRAGTILLVEARLVGDAGTIIDTVTSILHRGVRLDDALQPLPAPAPLPRIGEPIATVPVPTLPQQAAIFRLLLDLAPGRPSSDALHIDPHVATAAGFAAPLLHGPAVEGLIARSGLATGAFASLRGMEVRYKAPVFPGCSLLLRAWSDGVFAVSGPDHLPAAEGIFVSAE